MNGVTYDAGALSAAKHRAPVNAGATPKTLVRDY